MTNLNEQIRRLNRKLKNAESKARREAIKYLRKRVPEYIILRTKAGEGIDKELPKLKPSTIAFRERYRRNLAKDTSPSESNLTFSGQLLKAIISEIVDNGIVFKINDKVHKKVIKPKKPRPNSKNSTLTNNELREYLEEKGFEFFGLSKDDMKELRKEVIELVADIIKREMNAWHKPKKGEN